MWVIITEVTINEDGIHFYKGTLDNEPYHLKTIQYQDIVEFHEDHIIQIA